MIKRYLIIGILLTSAAAANDNDDDSGSALSVTPAPQPVPAARPATASSGSSGSSGVEAAAGDEAVGSDTLDLAALTDRLRNTESLGFFTKLELKSQIDSLLDDFRAHHTGNDQQQLSSLRERFELLLLKVRSLVQDDDPTLSVEIASAQPALWEVLTDPQKLADL
ncbi:MAG: hypothetical protein HOI95_00565 [Chromatiales bacterium]|nr:hypothetical protein [Chromatiales bacterium]